MTRTDAIQRALLEALNRHRAIIDSSPELASVTLTVKLQDGPDPVRAVNYEDQRVVAKRGRYSAAS